MCENNYKYAKHSITNFGYEHFVDLKYKKLQKKQLLWNVWLRNLNINNE